MDVVQFAQGGQVELGYGSPALRLVALLGVFFAPTGWTLSAMRKI
jgi:hypothetical protein